MPGYRKGINPIIRILLARAFLWREINSLVITPFENIKEPNYFMCPIGLDYFHPRHLVVIIKICGHMFGINELKIWMQNKKTCPMCRCRIF
jgi:hypothetical protein